MRSPGVIYRRYRQIKKKILYDRTVQAHLRLHENCYYGKEIKYTDNDVIDLNGIERTIKACVYNSTDNHIEICDNPQECNAYASKWTKEKIINKINEELSDPNIKRKYYPELNVLEWVLDKELHLAVQEPSFTGKIIIKFIEILESILRNSNNNQKK